MKNANQLVIEIDPANVPRLSEDKAKLQRVLASVSLRFGRKKLNWLARGWRRLLNPRCGFCGARLEVALKVRSVLNAQAGQVAPQRERTQAHSYSIESRAALSRAALIPSQEELSGPQTEKRGNDRASPAAAYISTRSTEFVAHSDRTS
jgi:hypothetical protein